MHLTEQAVLVADPHVEVTALLHQAIGEDLRLLPVQLGVVGDLHGQLGQGAGQLLVGLAAARAVGDVHAVGDLVAESGVDLRQDLVELERWAASLGQGLQVFRAPLQAAAQIHALVDAGGLHVVQVPTHAPVLVALPVLVGRAVGFGGLAHVVRHSSRICGTGCAAAWRASPR
ncbi:hypothetical protein D3C85_1187730 [compost metagenome]